MPTPARAVLLVSTSTKRAPLNALVACIASLLVTNPQLHIHVHTAHAPSLLLDRFRSLRQLDGPPPTLHVTEHAAPASSRPHDAHIAFKLRALQTLPAPSTLYLESNMLACHDLGPVFELLERKYDLACAHAHAEPAITPVFGRSKAYAAAKVPAAFVGCDGGVIGVRNGSTADMHVIRQWAKCVESDAVAVGAHEHHHADDLKDAPCLAALMWSNPSPSYYMLPPQYNHRTDGHHGHSRHVARTSPLTSHVALLHGTHGAAWQREMNPLSGDPCAAKLVPVLRDIAAAGAPSLLDTLRQPADHPPHPHVAVPTVIFLFSLVAIAISWPVWRSRLRGWQHQLDAQLADTIGARSPGHPAAQSSPDEQS